MSDCQSGVGASYARAKAMNRERMGTRVVITDQATGRPLRARPFPAVVRKMEPRDRDFLPQDRKNVAFSDVRVYELSPRDFPPAPAEGDGLAEQGQAFTIIGVPPADVMAGVPHTQVLICYRTPTTPDASGGVSSGAASYPTPDATL